MLRAHDVTLEMVSGKFSHYPHCLLLLGGGEGNLEVLPRGVLQRHGQQLGRRPGPIRGEYCGQLTNHSSPGEGHGQDGGLGLLQRRGQQLGLTLGRGESTL